MHWDVGGYRPEDIHVVAAWDVDERKVGRDVSVAIFAKPNCTTVFCDHVPQSGTVVRMGRKLDGTAMATTEHSGQRMSPNLRRRTSSMRFAKAVPTS